MSPSPTDPLRLLVAGGGVAGLETILALRDLAGDRVDVTLLTPEEEFVYRPMAVGHPFSRGHAQRHRLGDISVDLGARIVRGALVRVDDAGRSAETDRGERLDFDALMVAVGAADEPAVTRALTWTPERDPEVFGGLLRDIEEGYSKRVAFVAPRAVAWVLPVYELALMTGWSARDQGRDDVQLSIHTYEDRPLQIFGDAAGPAIEADLHELGITVHPGVEVTDGSQVDADRVVALPRAVGRPIPGLPSDERGFIPTDPFGKVEGTEHVWAAGDATAYAIKQGGIAAQQADAAATAIAALAGADVEPEPFKPVLRGVLLTGRGKAWLRSDFEADESESARRALFWPPTKIAGRYISPYLARLDDGPDAERAQPAGQTVDMDLAGD